MGKNKQLTIVVLLLIACIPVWGANRNAPPDDIATIEALIDAHKKMKKAEELAVFELGTTVGTHQVTTNLAAKYNKTRNMLNERLADVGSYISLASSILSISQQLRYLIESYGDFTETTYSHARRQPFLLLIYTSTNIKIEKEIEHIVKSCADFTLFQTNVLKATMDEKRRILGFISMHIANVQRMINKASMTCRSVSATGVKEYHVMDIMNSETNQQLMERIISKWRGTSN